ncbi:MAG TPA: tail fiber domain-containing protein [Leptospiraceae bacterium]|nr:tail fiber domain-containing protein [Leptospiraceae bacterium]
MKQIFKRKGSGIGTQGSENKGVGSVGIGFEPVPAGNFIDLAGFKKGISIGLGIILTLATSAVLAVAVTGTINTFSSGNVVDASQINTNFASLKTAIEGITSSQWTTSGSNIYYNAGAVSIGTTNPSGACASCKFVATGGILGSPLFSNRPGANPWNENGLHLQIDGTTYGKLALHSTSYLRTDIGFIVDNNVGIGQTSPSEKLEVVGDIKVGTSGSNGCLKNFGGGTITGTCSSDEKLKKDIRPMESVLDKVSQLVPKTYHWRSEEYPNKKFGTQKEYGLVAQDVEKIFPDMVENDSNGLKAIHYERLPILTVQAVKELSLRLRGATEDLDREKLENAKLKQKLLSVEERLNVLERMVKK